MECFWAAVAVFAFVGLLVQVWRSRKRLTALEQGLEHEKHQVRMLDGQLIRLKLDFDALKARIEDLWKQRPSEPLPSRDEVKAVTSFALPVPKKEATVEPPPEAALGEEVPAEPVPPPPPLLSEGPSPGAPTMAPAPEEVPLAPPPRAPKPPARPPRPAFDWERLIGVKLFSWVAGILFALAAVYFLRISIDRGWLSHGIRMAIGLLFGTGLLVVCELKAARRYAVTANALDAAGIATLFATIFASHALWDLLPTLPTFLLMALITAVAVTLSIRRDSLFIALLGLIGGFATPALLSTGEDRPIGLFGYLLLLNAGLAWVARKRRWKVLPVLSLVGTVVYQWGWALKFLDASRLPLAVGIFLVFPLLAFAVPLLDRRREDGCADEGFEEHSRRVAAWTSALPLLFTLYLAVVPAYAGRYPLLFGFLLILDLGLAVLAAARGPRLLHPLAGGATLVVFATWLGTSYSAEAWPAVLAWLAAFVLFYLGAPWIAARFRLAFDQEAPFGTLAAPLLLFAFPVLLAIEPLAAPPGTTFGVLFLLLAATAAAALLYEEGWLHFVASFFALAAEAVWSARHLTEARLLSGVALYGLFGLFYLGVPLLARRLRRSLRPEGSGAVLLLLSLGLLFFLTAGAVAPVALWGLALLLAVLNLGLFFEGRFGRWPWLSLGGMVLSWIVIGVWWASVPLGPNLVPALAVVTGLAVLMMAGSLWMQRRAPVAGRGGAADTGQLGEGVFLGLVGHLFLLFVVTQPSLAIPPWPVLAVLAVLDLAIGVAALWARRSSLHLGALVASNAVLGVWVGVAKEAPWPMVAAWSVAAIALFALLWIAAGRRVAGEGSPLAVHLADGAVAALFLGMVVLIVAGNVSGAPGIGLLLPLHVAFLVAILALAATPRRLWTAVLAVPVTAIAFFSWKAAQASAPPGVPADAPNAIPTPWWHELLFAGAIYLAFLAWPLVLGARTKKWREPYLAAILAAVPFFFAAHAALLRGGFAGVIGILPVGQAIAHAVLLAHLLRQQPPGERLSFERGRLALVAGTVLAFVSVAIPLQLEKQWITLGWALLAAALAWLYGKVPHRGLLAWTAGLLVLVFVRLALNPAVLTYHPAGARAIWNWYLYAYLVAALAFFLAGWLLLRTDDRLLPAPVPRLSTLASGGAVILLFLLLNIEIADYFSTGDSLTFGFLTGNASLAEDLTSTLGWAVFAIALFVAGIALRNRAARVAAILLLLGASLKGFLHDLARLGGLYRVGSFVGLAASLALVAVLLQKFVLRPREEEPEAVDEPQAEGEE